MNAGSIKSLKLMSWDFKEDISSKTMKEAVHRAVKDSSVEFEIKGDTMPCCFKKSRSVLDVEEKSEVK